MPEQISDRALFAYRADDARDPGGAEKADRQVLTIEYDRGYISNSELLRHQSLRRRREARPVPQAERLT